MPNVVSFIVVQVIGLPF